MHRNITVADFTDSSNETQLAVSGMHGGNVKTNRAYEDNCFLCLKNIKSLHHSLQTAAQDFQLSEDVKRLMKHEATLQTPKQKFLQSVNR